jgi:hypothetical protein
MGRAKQHQVEMEDGLNLWGLEGKHVCRRCLGDDGLRAFARANAESPTCSYCGRTSKKAIAAPIGALVRFMDSCLASEFDVPENWLFYDDEAESGWAGEVCDTADLVDHELDLRFEGESGLQLRDDIIGGLGDRQWCAADPHGPRPQDGIRASWSLFRRVLMHERRFFFLQYRSASLARRMRSSDATYDLSEWLAEFAAYCGRAGLFKVLPKKTLLYRAQAKPDVNAPAFTAGRMGPPPSAKAVQANRMSPPGIPMFYGAADRETALLETVDKPGNYAVAAFTTRKAQVVLDLSEPPSMPSLFDRGGADDRKWAAFTRSFLADFTKPVARDDRAHVDYVPTQAVTEYFRTTVKRGGRAVKGIRYRSSRPGGGDAVVLFANQSSVEGTLAGSKRRAGRPWLKMSGYEEVQVAPPRARATSRAKRPG